VDREAFSGLGAISELVDINFVERNSFRYERTEIRSTASMDKPTCREPAAVSNPSPSDEFLDLFTRNQLRLYGYVMMLVANRVDAEDVLQNVNLVMLKKCDQFTLGTNFMSWATGIAYLEAMKYLSAKKRTAYGLSEATLASLAADAVRESSALDHRNAALPDCMEQLPPADRELVTDHYFRRLSWEKIAAALGRTSSSVRHSICRIRRELKRCIDAATGTEEHL
jgi:RNA polymerase sigma-70 factor, ECF subfamily